MELQNAKINKPSLSKKVREGSQAWCCTYNTSYLGGKAEG
jgi:hypothetical protein